MVAALRLKTSAELAENLTDALNSVEHNRNKTKKLKKEFETFNISPGEVEKVLSNPKEEIQLLVEANNVQFLCVVTICTFNVTFDDRVDPLNYFTNREIKEIKSTFQGGSKEKLTFPLTIPNVTKSPDGDDYLFYMNGSDIKEWQDSNLYQYNFETQREARTKTDKNTGAIIQQPKLISNSVDEIVELMEKGKAISSVLTFNARLGTSNGAEELVYDDKNKTLTIAEGTLLDILDGFHRLTSITLALSKDPNADMTWKINIVNLNSNQAEEYFAQLNTTNPISKGRLKEAKEVRQADFIVKQIQADSELGNYLTKSDRIAPRSNMLVSFNVFSDAIHEVFNIKDKLAAIDIAEYLAEFFDKLMLSHSEAFMTDIVKVRENSIININQMFVGYVVLAKRFHDDKIKLTKLQKVMNSIDFSRDNEMWQFLNILDENKSVTGYAGKKIIEYFKNLSIK